MSVPGYRRDKGKLDINTKARKLCTYTLQITANDKVFLPSQQYFIQRLNAVALDIQRRCWLANNIYVNGNMERYKTRLEHEAKAIDACTDLLALIDIAKSLFHLTTKRATYWSNMVIDLRKDIRAWRTDDSKRLLPSN